LIGDSGRSMVPVEAFPQHRVEYHRDPRFLGGLVSAAPYPPRTGDYCYYAFADISTRFLTERQVSKAPQIFPSIDAGSGRLPGLQETFTTWTPRESTLRLILQRYLDRMEGLYPSLFVGTAAWTTAQDARQCLERFETLLSQLRVEAQAGARPALRISVATRPETASDARGPLEESTEDLIAAIPERLPVTYAERLANRLRHLVEVSHEEYPEQVPMSALSVMAFIRFLEHTPNLCYPDIVLTPSGNVRAQWRRAANRHFAAEFLEYGEVRYVVFAPDPKYPDTIARASGQVRAESLMEVVRPLRVAEWAAEGPEDGE
jgi:hypothetical protein